MKIERIDHISDTSTFNVTSGALRVTDPCYDMDTWCAGTLSNVTNGEWTAHVGRHKDGLDGGYMERYWQEQREEIAKDKELEESLRKANPNAPSLAHPMSERRQQRLDEHIARHLAYKGRVAYLYATCNGTPFDHKLDPELQGFVASDIDVGVDSGQAGVFDLDYFASVQGEKNEDWYDKVCEITLRDDDQHGDIEQRGYVSSSGYGDGGYPLFVKRDESGAAVAVLIVYICEEEDDGEDDADEATEGESHVE